MLAKEVRWSRYDRQRKLVEIPFETIYSLTSNAYEFNKILPKLALFYDYL